MKLFGLMGTRRAGSGSAPGLRIVPLSVPTAEFGVAYEATWQVLGGTAPYSLTDSTLPDWADAPDLTDDIITVTGTPDAVDAVAHLLEVTDDASTVATREGTITTVAVVPDAPTNAAATGGDTEAEVSFDAPASDGGATITQYDVTSDPGGVTASGASSPITVTGLTNGVEVTFTVTATNSVGEGPASDPSNAVTPSAGYTTSGTDYDGTNDYAAFGGGINGGADASQGIISFWFRIDGGDGTDIRMLEQNFPQVNVTRDASNKLKSLMRSDSTILLNASGATTLTAGATWHHVLACFDTTSATTTNNFIRIYLDDAAEIVDNDVPNQALNFSTTLNIGSGSAGASKFNGCLSEVYIRLGETLDPTVEANRRKFIDASGKPVSLGADGSTPTGNQPQLYAPDGDPSTNLGTAGNATMTGSPTASSTSPSD